MGNKLSLRQRVIGLSVVLAIVVFIEGLVLYQNNDNIVEQANQIGEVEMPVLNTAHKLKLAVVQVQQWLTDISATRGQNGLDDGFAQAEKNATLFKQYIAQLQQLDGVNSNQYRDMSAKFDQFYAAGKQMAQVYIDQGPQAGNQMMADFDQAAESLNRQVDPFLQQVQTRVEQEIHSQTDAAALSGYLVNISSFILLVLVSLMSMMLIKAITQLPKVVAQMTSGDLSQAFNIEGNDELSQIMISLESMRARLRNMVTDIAGSTNQLSQAATGMAAISSKTSEVMQRQFAETEQVATAINEMTISSQEVANTIALTSEAAKAANSETSNGQLVVNDAIAQINTLAEKIDDAAQTIHQLEQDSESIAGVLDVIKSIAEQTNLLALNAAIEAARAGEQGRGFAVVADEVRTLASRTQQSTEEINHMLEKLLRGSSKAVEVMNASKQQAESAVQKASDTGDSLTTISTAVDNIYDMSCQIASAAEEQSVVAEEINQNVVRINGMSNESVNNINEATAASSNMEQMSKQLKDIVDQFRT